ncbi:MAG TPA: serine/threonine-protein kinase, partial [Labilithrix sp.]|nr:serine/threonine-protein kinase [Labilithrix sp.]
MRASIPPGKVFGRYRIVRVIGSGGMGTVYEARHTELDRRVAVKVLPRRFAENPVVLGRFMREGRAVARIEHPHVVVVSDVGMEDGTPYLVMEYLEGESLGALLARERRLEVSRAIDLLVPVVSAVSAAHAAGIVHRDLKPDNVLLVRTPHGVPHPKVLDFGISKMETEHGVTATGMLLGTPKYMSPEQALNSKDVSTPTDQWSLGVIIYECITGRPAFQSESLFELLQRISSTEYTPMTALAPDVPEALEHVVERAMARDPAARYPSMLDFGRALLPFASQETAARWTAAFDERAAAPSIERRAVEPRRGSDRTVTGADDGRAAQLEQLLRRAS